MSTQNLSRNLEGHSRCHIALPEIGKLRFAEVTDAPFIFKLVNEQMAKTFRISDSEQIVYLM